MTMLVTITLIYLVSFGLLAALYLTLRRAGGLSHQFFAEPEADVGLPASAMRRGESEPVDVMHRTRAEYQTAH